LCREGGDAAFSCGDISIQFFRVRCSVVVEETEMELTVVTLYKTSKFAKYEGGA